MVFDEPVVNLGRTKAIGRVECRFDFRVEGNEPAEILDLRPSCGCLRPELTQRLFPPGHRGQIVLAIHATGQPAGPKRFQLGMTLRDPQPRQAQLAVEADFVSQMTVQPASLLIHLGAGDRPVRHEVTIVDHRDRPIQIEHLATSSPHVLALLAPAVSSRAEVAIVVEGDLIPAGQFHSREERVVIHTDDPDHSPIEIPVTVQRIPPVVVLPERITFTPVSPAVGPWRRQLHVRALSGDVLEVLHVFCDQPEVSCSHDSISPQRARIHVQLDRRPAPGRAETEVRIRLAQPVAAELRVPLRIE